MTRRVGQQRCQLVAVLVRVLAQDERDGTRQQHGGHDDGGDENMPFAHSFTPGRVHVRAPGTSDSVRIMDAIPGARRDPDHGAVMSPDTASGAPERNPRRVPRPAAWLGGLGLVPFAAGAAGTWLLADPRREAALFLLAAYAAVILSFMGAVHWGLALREAGGPPARALGASVVPALLAWFALSIPPAAGLVVMAVGFAGVYVLDVRAVAAGMAPAWYPRLRVPLTAAVLACLGIAMAGVLLRGGTP